MTNTQQTAINRLHSDMVGSDTTMQHNVTLILGTGDMIGLSANSEDALRDIVHWFVMQFGVLAGSQS